MFILIISLLTLAIVAIVAMYFSKSDNNNSETPLSLPDEECCGAHDVCEVNLKKLSKEVIYFEDEDLDTFSHKAENTYNAEEIDQFREILYTLKKMEIKDWMHSLELREITMPDVLKPEVRMLLSE